MFINRNLLFYGLFVSSLICIISYYFFSLSGFNYFFDDVYVYLAYSESLYNLGHIEDLTTLPSTASITTQNGIVFIFAFLNYFTNDMLIKMNIVSFILTINLIFIYFLIYKIGLLLDIEKEILYMFILGLIFNFYFYAYYVAPTNDGFYISFFFLSLYLFIKLSIENNQKFWFYLLIIILIMSIFRLQGLVVYIAALISFLTIKKEYQKSMLILLFIILSFLFVKLTINLFIEDLSGLEMISKVMIIYHLDTLEYTFIEIFTNVIPSIFLNFPASNLDVKVITFIKVFFSFLIVLFSLMILKNAFLKKNFAVFMIALIIFGNFGALILFNVIIDRYIYINATLLSLIFFYYINYKYKRILAVILLILSIVTFSLRLYLKAYPYEKIESNINYLNINYKDYNLISQTPRQFYFYLKKPTITSLEYLNMNLPIILLGDDKFIKDKIENIRESKLNIKIKDLPISWEIKKNEIFKSYEITIINKEEKI